MKTNYSEAHMNTLSRLFRADILREEEQIALSHAINAYDDIIRAYRPIPMRLTCPSCNLLHVDEPPFDTKPHHTHACQGCGAVWRPAVQYTVGVRFLPGYKNPTGDQK